MSKGSKADALHLKNYGDNKSPCLFRLYLAALGCIYAWLRLIRSGKRIMMQVAAAAAAAAAADTPRTCSG